MESDKYRAMRAAGARAEEIYRTARIDGMDDIACIRLLRQLFNLSLVEAKEVIVVAEGQATSLQEHQGTLKTGLEKAFEEIEEHSSEDPTNSDDKN
jgi:ribosomal protein L7/L12